MAKFVLFLALIAFVANIVNAYSTFDELASDLSTKASVGKGAYVLSMQRCSSNAPWTLHGLWPQSGQDCTKEAFNVSQVTPIRARLEKDWLSCPGHQGNIAFWSHEWSKHGTCATKVAKSQLQYFSLGLNLLQRYRGNCTKVTSGECRICLNDDLTMC